MEVEVVVFFIEVVAVKAASVLPELLSSSYTLTGFSSLSFAVKVSYIPGLASRLLAPVG